MANISVTPEQLIDQAKVYLQAKEGINVEISKVEQMNETISTEWQGQAFNAYLEQYAQLKDQAVKYTELLENVNTQLNKYAQTMQDRDQQDALGFGF